MNRINNTHSTVHYLFSCLKPLINRSLFLFLVIGIVMGGLLTGCGSSSSSPDAAGGGNPGEPGAIALLLTDAPTGNFSKVVVTVTEANIFSDSEKPVTLFKGSRRIDLLSLEEVEELFMIQEAVPSGFYEKIRLKVEDPEFVKADGTVISSDQIHLVANGKIDLIPKENFHVVPGEALVVHIDFDAKKSIKIHPTSSDKYQLRPVVFVSVLDGFKDRLLSLKGLIESFDTADNSFILKRTGHHFPHSDDDDAEHPYRIKIFYSNETRIIDAKGDVVDFNALDNGQHVNLFGVHFNTFAPGSPTFEVSVVLINAKGDTFKTIGQGVFS